MSDLLVVTGATGTIGRHVCTLALARGLRVRAVTRDPSRAEDLAEAGAEVVRGDFTDDDLASRFEGADAAFVMVPLQPDTVELGTHTHDALEAAGVARAVRLSVISPIAHSDTFLGRWHTELDADFANRDFQSAVVRPHSFMENFLGSAESIRQGKLVGANADGRTPYIAAADVALCAVALAASPTTCSGTHDLTGPAAASGEDIAEAVGTIAGHDVEWVNMEPEAHESMLREHGLPDLVVELVTDLARLAREGVGAEPTRGFERLIGRHPEDFVSWAKRHREVFARG